MKKFSIKRVVFNGQSFSCSSYEINDTKINSQINSIIELSNEEKDFIIRSVKNSLSCSKIFKQKNYPSSKIIVTKK